MHTHTLFYAMGGGLGHLQRCVALLKNTIAATNNAIICSASPHLPTFAQQHGLRYYNVPTVWATDKPALTLFLTNLLQKEKIKTIYIDVFPLGIMGEWNEILPQFPAIELVYIARRMKWELYEPLIKYSPQFSRTLVVEDLQPDHWAFVCQTSTQIIEQKVKAALLTTTTQCPIQEDFYLILHSEPAEEIAVLLHYAYDKQQLSKDKVIFVVVSQIASTVIQKELNNYLLDAKITYLKTFDTDNLVKQAKKIFTACGFNTMYYLQDYSHKHYYIPFERKYDDQFWRSKNKVRPLSK
jgi:hypothetical protein